MRLRVIAMLLICLLVTPLALSDSDWADTDTYTPYSSSLLMRLATREGPSTEYAEPGSFFKAGDSITVLSIAYDVNQVPWVQVEFSYRGVPMRAYTGLKRVNISPSLLPVDSARYDATVSSTTSVYRGPGTGYQKYGFTLSRGTRGTVWNIENGYAQFVFTDTDAKRLVWVPTGSLTSASNVPTRGKAVSSSSYSAHVVWTVQPYAGPGTEYSQYDFLVYSGTHGTVYSTENGYVLFAYDPGSGNPGRIVWLPASCVEAD